MSMVKPSCFLLLALLSANVVRADEIVAPQPPAASVETVPVEDKVICTTERQTGSNLPHRVCMTASQRAAMRDNAHQVMSSARRKTSAIGGGG
ncbi:hypothetical protein [Hydrocarboniphaga sp.]|uniref:hypothetical protein n=1 Tax=Hydrocarboniphaga sp. TaxID=2033016 RepID=UPI003D0B678D